MQSPFRIATFLNSWFDGGYVLLYVRLATSLSELLGGLNRHFSLLAGLVIGIADTQSRIVESFAGAILVFLR